MSRNPKELDDVAKTAPPSAMALALDEVGLEQVQTLALIEGQRTPVKAAAWVSLKDTLSRGIHMSRLYKVINRLSEKELNWSHLQASLEEMLATHSHLSDAGALSVDMEFPV